MEAHSVAGGAAHCWSRRGCNFDSGTALFFGLPAQQQQQSAAAAAATTTSSSGSNSALGNPAAVSAAAGSGAALAASIEGSSSSRGARSPDNPLAAVLQILGQSLDVVPYGPDRTCLVFPEGTFKAQVGGCHTLHPLVHWLAARAPPDTSHLLRLTWYKFPLCCATGSSCDASSLQCCAHHSSCTPCIAARTPAAFR